MPTILNWNGYRFFFFSNEGAEPPHIHVAKDGAEAKFWLEDCSLVYNDDFKHNELRKLQEVVRKNRRLFMEKWNEYEKRKH